MGRIPSRTGCELAREQISAALDHELSPLGSLRLRAHTAVCPACRGYRGELRSLTAMLRNERRPRGLPHLRLRTLVAVPIPVAALAAVFVVAIGPGHQHQPAYRGGALDPRQGMPVYDTSISHISQFLH